MDVSVILPCHDAARFLDASIGSVVAQEGVSVEIIAVEDHSTDDTWNRLRALAARHPALTLLRTDRNRGQATARNLGIAAARGRYVAFLDADDAYTAPDVLARWVAEADARDMEMCVAGFSRWDGAGLRSREPLIPLVSDESGVADLVAHPAFANCAQSWQILYRRAFLEHHGLRFSQRLRQREDRLFFVTAMLRASRIGVHARHVVLYRAHDASTMRRIDYDQMAQFTLHMKLMREAIEAARAEGRVGVDFERANAQAYLRQLLSYWRALIVPVLGGQARGRAEVEAFLAALHALTGDLPALWPDRVFMRRRDGMLREGVMDMARLALIADRRDLLHRLLLPMRLHLTQVRALAREAGVDWGEEAAQRYLCFQRDAALPEDDTARAPPLAALVRRVIVHVGLPKTGTSALQGFCEAHRFALLDRGIWYPVGAAFHETGGRRDRSPGHLLLLRDLVEDPAGPRATRRLAQLRAEIASLGQPVDTLILSAENVASHLLWCAPGDAAPVARILAALGVEEVELALVLRRPDQWFASYYREVIANPFNGVTASPMAFFEALEQRGLFDQEALVGAMQALPGVRRLHVASHEGLRASGGTVAWFLGLLGDAVADMEPGAPLTANTSLTDAQAANVRLMKTLYLDRETCEGLLRKVLASDELAGSRFSLIARHEGEAIAARLKDPLRAFDARFPGLPPPGPPGGDPEAPLAVLPDLARASPAVGWDGLPTLAPPGPSEKPVPVILAEHHRVITSRSWALTAPLRALLLGARALHARITRPR